MLCSLITAFAELSAATKSFADDLAYDLDTLKEELVATEDGLNAKLIEEQLAREALEADFGNKLGSSVHLLGDRKSTRNLHAQMILFV
jgi:hypothetical protein